MRMKLRATKRLPAPEKVVKYMLEQSEGVLRNIGRQSRKQREKTTKTWTGAAPSWYMKLSRPKSYTARLEVFMTGITLGMKKWYWVSKGTKVRYAVMTKNFKPKTKFRVISSYKGRGHMRYVDPHIMRPGIQAREFDEEINERMSEKVESQLDTRVKRALKRKRF